MRSARFISGRLMAGIAVATLAAGPLSVSALAQAQPAPPAGSVAGTVDPAAEGSATRRVDMADFRIAEGVVALVNDSLITSFDLRQRMLLLVAMTQLQPTEENLPAIQRQALNALIDERLQAQELARYELRLTDEDVEAEIEEMARQSGVTARDYYEYLAEIGVQPETLREQIRVQEGWRILVQGRYINRARVSRTQVQQTLDRLASVAAREQYLLGEVYLEASRVGGMQRAMDGANQLVQQMLQGAPFQAVARQFSAAPSAESGGDAGWVVLDDLRPELRTAVQQMEPGQLSRPIQVQDGVYILFVRDRRSGAATNYATLRQAAIQLPETASDTEVENAAQRLSALRQGQTCDSIIGAARAETGMVGSDLGEVDIEDLPPQFQQIARSAEIGAVSAPVRTPFGVHVVAVCNRRVGAAGVPSYQQVENSLINTQLSMLARRYIRDLRDDATVVFP